MFVSLVVVSKCVCKIATSIYCLWCRHWRESDLSSAYELYLLRWETDVQKRLGKQVLKHFDENLFLLESGNDFKKEVRFHCNQILLVYYIRSRIQCTLLLCAGFRFYEDTRRGGSSGDLVKPILKISMLLPSYF